MLIRFLSIIDLHILIPTFITQFFNSIAELAISIGIPTKDTKAEMETHPVIVIITIRELLVQLKTLQNFLCFSLVNSFRFIYSTE